MGCFHKHWLGSWIIARIIKPFLKPEMTCDQCHVEVWCFCNNMIMTYASSQSCAFNHLEKVISCLKYWTGCYDCSVENEWCCLCTASISWLTLQNMHLHLKYASTYPWYTCLPVLRDYFYLPLGNLPKELIACCHLVHQLVHPSNYIPPPPPPPQLLSVIFLVPFLIHITHNTPPPLPPPSTPPTLSPLPLPTTPLLLYFIRPPIHNVFRHSIL